MQEIPPPRLPAAYRSRPACADDVHDLHLLLTACGRGLRGNPGTGLDTISADLALPGLDPALDTLLVHDTAGEPAARAWVHGGRRSQIDVHPNHRGRGLGTALADWAEARARQAGSERLAQTAPDDDREAVRLLRSRGYRPFVTQWQLELAMAAEPVVPDPPEGITVRSFRPGDEQVAYRLTEDAFGAWQKRRKSYAEWALHTVGLGTFEPAASSLAFAGPDLVGAVLSLDVPGSGEGYVERVAVRQDHRHRGIARLLLQSSFRAFHRRGHRTCTLWTHSKSGALPLYEGLGMTVRQSSTVYGKVLTAG